MIQIFFHLKSTKDTIIRMAEPCSFFAGGYRCCVCLSTRARRRLYVSFEQQLSRARRKLCELAYVQ
jgi:hypothetical protein